MKWLPCTILFPFLIEKSNKKKTEISACHLLNQVPSNSRTYSPLPGFPMKQEEWDSIHNTLQHVWSPLSPVESKSGRVSAVVEERPVYRAWVALASAVSRTAISVNSLSTLSASLADVSTKYMSLRRANSSPMCCGISRSSRSILLPGETERKPLFYLYYLHRVFAALLWYLWYIAKCCCFHALRRNHMVNLSLTTTWSLVLLADRAYKNDCWNGIQLLKQVTEMKQFLNTAMILSRKQTSVQTCH